MITIDLPYILSDLFDLTKYDPCYSEESYNNLLRQKNKLSTAKLSQDDYLDYFKDFEFTQITIRILFNYVFLLNEFENGEHPLFDGIKDLKKHNTSLNTYISAIEKTLKITSLFEDKHTNEQLVRTVQFIRQFQDYSEDFINRLYFFQILKMTLANEMPEASKGHIAKVIKMLLMNNPYDDPFVERLEDCNFYFGLLKLFDGYNINSEMLLTSTVIKIHKLFALHNENVYKKRNNPSKIILSIFEKMGRSPKIDLGRFHDVIPKTFYKGNAIFDYKDEHQKYKVNPYFDLSLKKALDFIAMQNRLSGKTETSSDYDQTYENWINKLYWTLIIF
jgi:hypothetical protein